MASLGFLSFAAVYNNLLVSPVLVEIARDMGVTVGTAGLLVTAFGLPGIVVAVLAGPLSDRYGRKPFLVGGTVLMSVLTVLGAVAPGFAHLLLTRVGAGVGASVLFPNMNATIADEFPYQERGRAMSMVISLNQLATIVGVPLAGLIASATSWRVSFALVGAIGLVAAAVVMRSTRSSPPPARTEIRVRELFGTIFGDTSVKGAIASSLLGAIFFFTWITYVVAFFVERFRLPTATASLIVLVTGIGIVAGSQIGGRVGDRFGHRSVVGWTVVGAGIAMLAVTVFVHDLWLAVALAFVIAAFSGARFAGNMTLISELAPSARGTVLSVNSAIVSIGIVVGTSVGGILVDTYGYEGLGIMTTIAAFASAVIVWRYVTERTAEFAAGEAVD